MIRSSSCLLAMTALFVLLCNPLGAQNSPEEDYPWPPPGDPRYADQAADDPTSETRFFDEVTVSLRTVVARVVNRRGEPILGLEPEDLSATVGGVEVPIQAVDWYTGTSGSPAAAAIDTLDGGDEGFSVELKQQIIESTDRLVVLFIQIGHAQVVTLDESYVSGHLKLLPHLRGLLDELDPEDRVAVVSYDYHLKVWQDFTLDREAVNTAIYESIGFGKPLARRNHRLSLVDALDPDAMEAATTPELALLATARALGKLPGIKDLIFVGWGLGRYTHGVGVLMPKDYSRAVSALGNAQATVSVLDVTQTDNHALASGLKSVAAATGGTYDSTFDAVGRKVDRLGRMLTGYYIVTLDRSAMPAEGGTLKIDYGQRNTSVLHASVVYPSRIR